MIIMTEKKVQEKMQKIQEEQWRMEREAKMIDRIFALEMRVDKLEGKGPVCECNSEHLTPVEY